MNGYLSRKRITVLPRLPLEGSIDLTYRCNNDCLHCWLRLPPDSPEDDKELTFDEIRALIGEAGDMGCGSWKISGGEPMLRPDFADIFDLILSRSRTYTLNTNGTLITPRIARLMKRPGFKMIAFYGATADVHDRITRTPGSFEAFLEGIARLKEAGAGFTVQLVPMKDNFRQFKDMIRLAGSLSPTWRLGASWLVLSARRDPGKNREICGQRLAPAEVASLYSPESSTGQGIGEIEETPCPQGKTDDLLFASCLDRKRDFHVDPYGGMSFCAFIKDPRLRADLRKMSFREAWETALPGMAGTVVSGPEYRRGCGACDLREDCEGCPVFGYLEHGRFGARIDYLCRVAKERKIIKESWLKSNVRHFRIAGITIRVESELPFQDTTFGPKFKFFEVDGPGDDNVVIRHRFFLPPLAGRSLGKEIYRRLPWAIFEREDSWLYLGVTADSDSEGLHKAALFTKDYGRGTIYHPDETSFRRGNSRSLTFFPTDQILIAQLLALRNGCYLHASGVSMKGRGLLFMGHSDAGKSTMIGLIKDKAEILCDDRMIVRRERDGYRIHGTWSHGEVPDVSAASAPLAAIFFLHKSSENRLSQVAKKRDITSTLLSCLIKPMATPGWWENTLALIEGIGRNVPCYDLFFDKGGKIVGVLDGFVDSLPASGKETVRKGWRSG
jgi:MoaA/NifB/PqqE/SkfB family radical SAM enzyme